MEVFVLTKRNIRKAIRVVNAVLRKNNIKISDKNNSKKCFLKAKVLDENKIVVDLNCFASNSKLQNVIIGITQILEKKYVIEDYRITLGNLMITLSTKKKK